MEQTFDNIIQQLNHRRTLSSAFKWWCRSSITHIQIQQETTSTTRVPAWPRKYLRSTYVLHLLSTHPFNYLQFSIVLHIVSSRSSNVLIDTISIAWRRFETKERKRKMLSFTFHDFLNPWNTKQLLSLNQPPVVNHLHGIGKKVVLDTNVSSLYLSLSLHIVWSTPTSSDAVFNNILP